MASKSFRVSSLDNGNSNETTLDSLLLDNSSASTSENTTSKQSENKNNFFGVVGRNLLLTPASVGSGLTKALDSMTDAPITLAASLVNKKAEKDYEKTQDPLAWAQSQKAKGVITEAKDTHNLGEWAKKYEDWVDTKQQQIVEENPTRKIAPVLAKGQELAEAAGRMLPTIAISAATGGLLGAGEAATAAAAGSTAAKSALAGIQSAASNAGLAGMWLEVYDTALDESLNEGKDLDYANKKAFVDATLEVATEKMFGGIAGLAQGESGVGKIISKVSELPAVQKLAGKVSDSALGNAVASVSSGVVKLYDKAPKLMEYLTGQSVVNGKITGEFSGILGEAVEEMVSETFGPGLERLATGDTKENIPDATLGQVLEAGLGGAILSVAMSPFSAIQDNIQKKNIEKGVEQYKLSKENKVAIANNVAFDTGLLTQSHREGVQGFIDWALEDYAVKSLSLDRDLRERLGEPLLVQPGKTTEAEMDEYLAKASAVFKEQAIRNMRNYSEFSASESAVESIVNQNEEVIKATKELNTLRTKFANTSTKLFGTSPENLTREQKIKVVQELGFKTITFYQLNFKDLTNAVKKAREDASNPAAIQEQLNSAYEDNTLDSKFGKKIGNLYRKYLADKEYGIFTDADGNEVSLNRNDIALRDYGKDNYSKLAYDELRDVESKFLEGRIQNSIDQEVQNSILGEINQRLASSGADLRVEYQQDLDSKTPARYDLETRIIYLNPAFATTAAGAEYYLGHEVIHKAYQALSENPEALLKFKESVRTAMALTSQNYEEWYDGLSDSYMAPYFKDEYVSLQEQNPEASQEELLQTAYESAERAVKNSGILEEEVYANYAAFLFSRSGVINTLANYNSVFLSNAAGIIDTSALKNSSNANLSIVQNDIAEQIHTAISSAIDNTEATAMGLGTVQTEEAQKEAPTAESNIEVPTIQEVFVEKVIPEKEVPVSTEATEVNLTPEEINRLFSNAAQGNEEVLEDVNPKEQQQPRTDTGRTGLDKGVLPELRGVRRTLSENFIRKRGLTDKDLVSIDRINNASPEGSQIIEKYIKLGAPLVLLSTNGAKKALGNKYSKNGLAFNYNDFGGLILVDAEKILNRSEGDPRSIARVLNISLGHEMAHLLYSARDTGVVNFVQNMVSRPETIFNVDSREYKTYWLAFYDYVRGKKTVKRSTAEEINHAYDSANKKIKSTTRFEIANEMFAHVIDGYITAQEGETAKGPLRKSDVFKSKEIVDNIVSTFKSSLTKDPALAMHRIYEGFNGDTKYVVKINGADRRTSPNMLSENGIPFVITNGGTKISVTVNGKTSIGKVARSEESKAARTDKRKAREKATEFTTTVLPEATKEDMLEPEPQVVEEEVVVDRYVAEGPNAKKKPVIKAEGNSKPISKSISGVHKSTLETFLKKSIDSADIYNIDSVKGDYPGIYQLYKEGVDKLGFPVILVNDNAMSKYTSENGAIPWGITVPNGGGVILINLEGILKYGSNKQYNATEALFGSTTFREIFKYAYQSGDATIDKLIKDIANNPGKYYKTDSTEYKNSWLVFFDKIANNRATSRTADDIKAEYDSVYQNSSQEIKKAVAENMLSRLVEGQFSKDLGLEHEPSPGAFSVYDTSILQDVAFVKNLVQSLKKHLSEMTSQKVYSGITNKTEYSLDGKTVTPAVLSKESKNFFFSKSGAAIKIFETNNINTEPKTAAIKDKKLLESRFDLYGSYLSPELDTLFEDAREKYGPSRFDNFGNERLSPKYEELYNEAKAKYGTMKNSDVPNRIEDSTKVSQFTRNVATQENLPEGLDSELKRVVVEGITSYTPLSDVLAEERAQAWLARYMEFDAKGNPVPDALNRAADEFINLSKDGKVNTKTDVAKGELVLLAIQDEIRRAGTEDVSAGLINLWEKVIGSMAITAHRSGQTVQAFSMLKKMTPSGRLYYIERALEDIKNSYAEAKDSIFSEARKTGKKVLQDYKIPTELVKQLTEAKTQQELDAAEQAIIDDIAINIPPTITSRFVAWRYLAMLGNVRTHERNMLSNAANYIATGLTNRTSGIIQDIFVKDGVRTATAKKATRATIDFTNNDWEVMKNVYETGGKVASFKTKIDQSQYKKDFGYNVVGQGLEWLSKKNSEWLQSEDAIFGKMAYRRAMENYITANNIDVDLFTNPETKSSKKAIELLGKVRSYAMESANKATYHEANLLATKLNELEKSSPLGQLLIGGIAPFKKTPFNILKQGAMYSGGGIIVGTKQLLFDVAKGKITAAEAIDNLCMGMTGTMIMALGMFLKGAGLLKAGGSDDDREEYYDEMLGNQKYSITIGNKNFTIDWLTPISMPLFTGATVMEAFDQTEGDSEDISFATLLDCLGTAFDPLTNLSLLSGINDAFSAYSDKNKLAQLGISAAESYVTQFIPTLSGQIARAIDPVRRSTYAPKDSDNLLGTAGERFLRRIASRIPGLSQTDEAYINQWGETQDKSDISLLGRLAEQTISPGYIATVKSTETDDRLAEIFAEAGTSTVLPATPSSNFTINGETYYLSAEDYTKVKKDVGKLSYQGVTSVMNSTLFDKLTADAKTDVVGDVYSFARTYAKYKYATENNIKGYTVDSSIKNVQSALDAGLTIGDYFVIKKLVNEFTADKDKTGKSIAGTKKQKQVAFLKSLGLTEAQMGVFF